MLYKTICLQLLEQQPALHDHLKSKRLLLPTLNRYALELKTSHQAWKEQRSKAKPGSDPSQIATEALEIALLELQDRLSHASPPLDNEAWSLDAAMALIRARTLPA